MVAEQGFCLKVGAVGWEADRWRAEFYPPDLPCAWQLSYYANEFSAVLVPDSYWFQAELPDTVQWREDVPDHFRFHIHVTQRLLESTQWFTVVDLCKGLKASLGSWVLGLQGESGQPIQEQLTVIPEATPPITILHTTGAATAAYQQSETAAECGDAVGLAVFAERPKPRILRTLIEDFIERSHGTSRMLFFDAPYGAVADARTIIRLLGF